MLEDLRSDLKKLSNPQKTIFLTRFFKTKEGEYGHGDTFLGISVPESRIVAKTYRTLPLTNIQQLLQSPVHEERLIALFILVLQFTSRKEEERKTIYNFYLKNTHFVNNWDLVDSSADKIVGEYLMDKKDRSVLDTLARSGLLWERRIAMIATYAFIKKGEESDALRIAEILVHDKHDLIQKAVGWMLREVGKRCSEEAEEVFLKKHYTTMPRTALRYAIERMPEEKRKRYLAGKI